MKTFAAVLLVLATAAFHAVADDSSRATPDEAKAMVKKAVAHFKKVGQEKAMPDFCKIDGAFVDRDLYVTVIALDGLEIAHINPKTVGKNVMDLRDPDGKYFIKERFDAAKTASSGWQEFKFFNPVTRKVEAKTAYWERVGDLVFSSGAYKPL
jgi:signal transduction histidine kinase